MEHKDLLELINVISKSNLTEFEYSTGDTKIYMSTAKTVASVSNCVAPADVIVTNAVAEVSTDVVKDENKKIVKSPLVGTFYVAPAQDAPPFVQVGDVVKKGQVLAIVEAMKLMNDIESDFDGKIVEIFVSNGESVEFGQPLFAIE
jgi:acetyl-CoA carboxylase biotin carboxyl carrier protein